MLEVHVSRRDTRLSNSGLRLVEPRSKLRFGGDRAFSVSAPRLCNALPTHMRDIMQLDNFKRQLKTLLFSESFSLKFYQYYYYISICMNYYSIIVLVNVKRLI